jgi:hypothetical protein
VNALPLALALGETRQATRVSAKAEKKGVRDAGYVPSSSKKTRTMGGHFYTFLSQAFDERPKSVLEFWKENNKKSIHFIPMFFIKQIYVVQFKFHPAHFIVR